MPVAQLVEHLTFNQGVRDSNSRGRTKKHQTVLTLSGAFLCCLSADSAHRAEIREPLRCFLLCKVQVFLHHGQACVAQNFPQAVYITAVFQVACSKRMPLRYNNDKQKKPLFSRGLSVCRLLFNSFSKLKIDENYKEKRRLFY